MIASIRGLLAFKSPEYIVVDVQGVGYKLTIPLSTFYRLPDEGGTVGLQVTTCVREDAFNLYGFMSLAEKEMFEQLIGVSKIGPRIGLNLLSGLELNDLAGAIAGGDIGRLASVPGVGVKTAQRLVLELKDKVRLAETPDTSARTARTAGAGDHIDDVVVALVSLGYKKKDAERVVREVLDQGGDSIEDLIKRSLARLSG